MPKKTLVSFKLNGQQIAVAVEPRELLIHTLRERCGHTGPHIGCDTSHCGACTVDMNGMSVKACTVLTVQAEGAELLSIEGMARGGDLHALQEGFMQEHGLQCGFCTPGMITRAYRLLKENPSPTDEEVRYWMAGNLCRCTGYQNIVKAVQYAARQLRGEPVTSSHPLLEQVSHEAAVQGPDHEVQEMSAALKQDERLARLEGIGCARKRREDPRFIQGRGTYVEDVKMPGMCFGVMVRSPYAHARVRRIDTAGRAGASRRCRRHHGPAAQALQAALDAHAGSGEAACRAPRARRRYSRWRAQRHNACVWAT